MSDRCWTYRPFTVAVCRRCTAEQEPLIMTLLRRLVRRSPHGVLVQTQCLVGEFTCATMHPSRSPIMVLQPCTVDRTPSAAMVWVGPIETDADARVACRWVAAGGWESADLPARLRADLNLARVSHQN